ncbi:MAG: 5'(3')-deoxyribonucleotidase [Flavobacterium sp.]
MKKTIAIDMDGVLADIEAHSLRLYKAYSGVTLSKKDILGKEEWNMLPEGLFKIFIHKEGFFRNAPVMDGAIEAVAKLSEEFEVYIVSAAMEFPLSLSEKHEWLLEHFPFISWKNIVFCGNKSIINADYMIDDHRKNLDTFKGKALMFSAFHNHGQNHHDRFDNWKSIVSFLEKELAV